MSEFGFTPTPSNLSHTVANGTDSYLVTTVDTYAGLNVPYTVCEVIVATCAVVGNALVILVFRKERRLRRRTNYYIISLATADLLVGLLGIPFAVLASIGLPRNLYACLFTVSLLVVLCTISIFCLVAVSVDRYWAILHPMAYSRNVRTKTAIGIIGLCWFSGSLIGFLPLLGWHADEKEDQRCLFTEVMDYNYLVFLYFATIIFPALLLAAFYTHIYQVVLKQLRQIVTMNPTPDSGSGSGCGGAVSRTRAANGGTMLRVFGAAQKREVKATKNLSIIVFFFIICWIPLYTINCVVAFCPDCHVSLTLTNCCIILSHLNSAGNPLLYAYHLRDFRAALKHLLCGIFGIKEEVPDYHGPRASFGSNIHHPHAVHNSRNNSLQSLRDINTIKLSSYADFKIANSCLSASLPPMPSDMQPTMWTLSEVPSICEDDISHSAKRRSSTGGQTPIRLHSRPGRGSDNDDETGNSVCIDGSTEFEEGDDDVFHDSVISDLKPSANLAHLSELPFWNCNLSTSSAWEDHPTSYVHASVETGSRSNSMGFKSCSENSVHNLAHRKNSQLIVEAEVNDGSVDIDDRTSSPDKSPVIPCYEDLNNVRANNNSNNASKADFEDKQCKNSPLKHLKRSPLKYVGDLLFKSDNKNVKDLAKKDDINLAKESNNLNLNGDLRFNEKLSSGDSSAVT